MDPMFDPRLTTFFSTPQGYEQFYLRGIPPSDFLSPNRTAIMPGGATANELQAIYRSIGGSPEKVPMGPPGKRFNWMAESPRPLPPYAQVTPEQIRDAEARYAQFDRMSKRAMEAARPPVRPTGFPPELLNKPQGLGGTALQLIPYLLMLHGDTDPDIAQWREERKMVTPPEGSRSVPDRLLAMPHKMTEEQARIQELADLIAKRRGRD